MPNNSKKKDNTKLRHQRAPKVSKFSGVLNEKISEPPPIFAQEEVERQINIERAEKMPALLQHYGIDDTSSDRFERLVKAIASDCIPGFQTKPYKVPTRGPDTPQYLLDYTLIRKNCCQNGGNKAKAIRDYIQSLGGNPVNDFDRYDKQYKRTRKDSKYLKHLLNIFGQFKTSPAKTIDDLDNILISSLEAQEKGMLLIEAGRKAREESQAGTKHKKQTVSF